MHTRRDKTVDHFQKQIAEKGENEIHLNISKTGYLHFELRFRGQPHAQLYSLRQFRNGDSESFRQNIQHGQADVLLASFHF